MRQERGSSTNDSYFDNLLHTRGAHKVMCGGVADLVDNGPVSRKDKLGEDLLGPIPRERTNQITILICACKSPEKVTYTQAKWH